MKRGIKVIYTPNGANALRNRLQNIDAVLSSESDCEPALAATYH